MYNGLTVINVFQQCLNLFRGVFHVGTSPTVDGPEELEARGLAARVGGNDGARDGGRCGNDFAFKVGGSEHPRLAAGDGNVARLGEEPGHPDAAAPHPTGISVNHAGTLAGRGGSGLL
jgi:hypothetical protein